MARALTNAVLKSLRGLQTSTLPARELVYGNFHVKGRHSTLGNDPDTHNDFLPNNKVDNSATSLKDIVEQDVKENPVMLYMKGVPEFPQCGFSALAVKVLQQYDVPLSARNILENQELKNAVKAFSHWPTFPQVFIKGEFIGGSDIILSMHQNGELKEKLHPTSNQNVD